MPGSFQTLYCGPSARVGRVFFLFVSVCHNMCLTVLFFFRGIFHLTTLNPDDGCCKLHDPIRSTVSNKPAVCRCKNLARAPGSTSRSARCKLPHLSERSFRPSTSVRVDLSTKRSSEGFRPSVETNKRTHANQTIPPWKLKKKKSSRERKYERKCRGSNPAP